MISIDQGRLDDLVRERILSALPDVELRKMGREILRHELGVLTLPEACRWLKWRSSESLRKALKRAGIDVIKTDPKKITVTIPDLITFREKHRIRRGSKKVVQMEGTQVA